ncbi:hypothetical protein K470DRAFT_223739 [Piedraia hortae CBS 480.64]|uniref:LAA1-like C-terminal TPR repeats domain-containing protein n=1 Tax=Piedraia hortae CBS 480.64 TaxID=1314780 RepID=A0A6A7BRD4_9PEZI|nr:hypothetical protein K470DRAFT_223739 [Piedraia hortae CBS 480.64]
MSTSPPPNPSASTSTDLDIQKLHALPSDQQRLYLLTYTTQLAERISPSTTPQTLLKCVTLSTPAPTRVMRANLARAYANLFAASSKNLYETINTLSSLLGGKEHPATQHAAATCLASIYLRHGENAVSLAPLVTSALIKSLRTQDVGLRAGAFHALTGIIQGIKGSIDEDSARAVWKACRSAAQGDKALLTQKRACECLGTVGTLTRWFDDATSVDKLVGAAWRAMESGSRDVRTEAAKTIARRLARSYAAVGTAATPAVRKQVPLRKSGVKGVKEEEGRESSSRTGSRTASPAAEKTHALSFLEVLKLLSAQYTRTTTSNRARAGIAAAYVMLFRELGEQTVERHYGEIAMHLFTELLNHPIVHVNKYRQMMTRRFVGVILEGVVGGMLGESAQLNAARFLINDVLKDYPQAIKERPEPTKQTLTGALSALTGLIDSLDSAIAAIADQCRDALLQVLKHPNFTVQVHTAHALRAFVLAHPQHLLSVVTICMNSVSRELGLLGGPRQALRQCIGHAYGLAALLSTSSHRPLYGAVDVYARVFQQATALLKSSSNSDLRISSCQVQVAWTMIGGLMSLGPNFVKIHLSQLLMLWKNALPKPGQQRNMLELSYLAHVRECALGSIKAFLTFNQKLLTADVSRRLAAMLENTVTFLQGLPERKTSEDPANRLTPAMQLQDYEMMVRARVFQCFAQLLILSPAESVEVNSIILPLAVATFSNSEYYPPSSLNAAIASAAAQFESIWDVGDNNGFGVTGLVRGLDVVDPVTRQARKHWSSREGYLHDIDRTLTSPIGCAAENDPTSCYLAESEFNPPGTEAVNSAIAVFSLCLPLQSPRIQESTLERISLSLTGTRDAARRAAITVNTAVALATASSSAKGDLSHSNTQNALTSLLHICLKDADQAVRQLTAEAIGAFCSASGNVKAEVTYLTETIVSNREPHVRAGCALALAAIHSQLGGMAAGFHMKQIVSILMSLAADTHPLVHCWALDALAQVAESAGLNYTGHVANTIGMLSQLYASDTHNAECAAVASSNMALELPVTAAMARGVDAVINVLGPDLQDMVKARDMILTMVRLFSQEDAIPVQSAALRCMEHVSVYAPGYLDFAQHVQTLQTDIESESVEISSTALHGLSDLMRRDATAVVKAARPGLEDALWDRLNSEPYQKNIRSIFTNWLGQTGSTDPADWIQRCNTILTKTKASAERSEEEAVPDVQDEEVAGFAVGEAPQAPTSTQELLRWQVRLFALELLSDLIFMITKQALVTDDSPGELALQSKVADVVRIAFSASTAGVTSLRVLGMRIIQQVLELFGKSPDPDFPDAMLLEQYQAQISSALTPAFATDSSPELAAAAVSVCATFIATGIVTDVDRMGRILKVLVSSLDNFSKDTDCASIGDLKHLSANALVMVRMAVFSAWAKLQIASTEQTYLMQVVEPHITQLMPLWLTSLREYSHLRFEPDISATLGTPSSGDVDTVYAALNRQTLLRFYQSSWLSLVDAIASLIDQDSEAVFDALDDREPPTTPKQINYREEPVAFFFVLFGLAFESLATRSSDDDIVSRQRNLEILQALKRVLRPSVSGDAVYQEVVFSETVDLLSRMVLTESLSVQSNVVEIARNLCIVHPSTRSEVSSDLSEEIEQLFELTRIIVLVLGNLIPGLSDSPVAVQDLDASDEATALAKTALQALVDVSNVFPTVIKLDLHAAILNVFVATLAAPTTQKALVKTTLPLFKSFVETVSASDGGELLTHAFTRLTGVLRLAQRREGAWSVDCETNVLLALTILLGSKGWDALPWTGSFIAELDGAARNPVTARVALGCLRTLLLAGVGARRIVELGIRFVLDPAVEGRDFMTQTLALYVGKVETRMVYIGLLVKVLLERARRGEKVADEILFLASVDQTTFRAVVGGLAGDERSSLEQVLKERAAANAVRRASDEKEPSIALKMDF